MEPSICKISEMRTSCDEFEESWTNVDIKDFALEKSCVSESMYIVMDGPASSLMHGESIECKAHALGSLEIGLHKAIPGTLFLTNYRVLFAAFKSTSDKYESCSNTVIEIPLCSIGNMKEIRGTKERTEIVTSLEIQCKNFRVVIFGFPYECSTSDMYQKLFSLKQSDCLSYAFLFPRAEVLPDRKGWGLYDPPIEFQRQGMNPLDSSSKWRLSTLNIDFSLCETYPQMLVVPSAVSDHELKKIVEFRSRGRIPAVTYLHSNGAAMARCAQPLIGIRRNRSSFDEAYVSAFRKLNPNNSLIYFVDCRSQTSAFGNVALGGGFESASIYKNSQLIFLGIENIHSMRDSFRRLFELVRSEIQGNEKTHWLSHLESTRWLEHVRSLLVSSSQCIDLVLQEKASLIVHCSDGWDRTAQICSLVKLCLDPFYRTLKGFQILIEQEWLSFGHRFADRCGYSSQTLNYWEDDNCSPVFPQFIDAVWQLTKQFPCSFEFNSNFLIALLDELYSSRSGSFIYNCERERMQSGAYKQTLSMWALLHKGGRNRDFINPFYISPGSSNNFLASPLILKQKWHTSSLSLWSEYYLRCRDDVNFRITQDLWAKEQQLEHIQLLDQLSRMKRQLDSHLQKNQKLVSELALLKTEKTELASALNHQVFCDNSNGVYVHEAEEEDGVLLSMTQTESKQENNACMTGDPYKLDASYFDIKNIQ